MFTQGCPRVDRACFQLKFDEPLSKFAFHFYLRRYTKMSAFAAAAAAAKLKVVGRYKFKPDETSLDSARFQRL